MTTLQDLGWSPFFSMQEASLRSPNLRPARLSSEVRERFTAITADAPVQVEAPPDRKPGVGDWVLLEDGKTGPTIGHALQRRTCLRRRAVGTFHGEQIVAANVDIVFLVTAMNKDFNLSRIERYLLAIRAGGAEPVVIINKADLQPEQRGRYVRQVEALDPELTIHVTSAVWSEGIEALFEHLEPGVTAGLVGTSGPGSLVLPPPRRSGRMFGWIGPKMRPAPLRYAAPESSSTRLGSAVEVPRESTSIAHSMLA